MLRQHSRSRARGMILFSQYQLFIGGEQGVLYDPNVLSALFQDSAGTVPVTAAGQPVGRMLDLSGRGNHAFIATAASRPILRQNATTGAYYLETDGIDDWMSTNPIDFTGTDKVSVFTGIRKLSDVAASIVAELSNDSNVSAGNFMLLAPSAGGLGNFSFRSKGSLSPGSAVVPGFASPASAALSAQGDIANDLCSLRVNGGASNSISGDQGTGSYGNHPLYLFRRGGTTLPFNGHFYGLTIVGRLCTAVETRNVELQYANKTGVILA